MDYPNLRETSRLQELYARRIAARGAGERAACVPLEAIRAVVEQEGDEDDRLATLDHVMACADCHREYEWLTAVEEAASAAVPRARGGVARPWWRQGAPLALAASVLLAVGLVLAPRWLRRAQPEPERGPGGDIAQVAPVPGAAVGLPFTLVWRPTAPGARYVLEVQTPDGTLVLADTTQDTTVTLADSARLVAGASYRWWVREATDAAQPLSSPFRTFQVKAR
jgi:hypothetical protein